MNEHHNSQQYSGGHGGHHYHDNYRHSGSGNPMPSNVGSGNPMPGAGSGNPMPEQSGGHTKNNQKPQRKYIFYSGILEAYDTLQRLQQSGTDLVRDSQAGLTDPEKYLTPVGALFGQKTKLGITLVLCIGISLLLGGLFIMLAPSSQSQVQMFAFIIGLGGILYSYIIPDAIITNMSKFAYGDSKKSFYQNIKRLWSIYTVLVEVCLIIAALIGFVFYFMVAESTAEWFGTHIFKNTGFAQIEDAINSIALISIAWAVVGFIIQFFSKKYFIDKAFREQKILKESEKQRVDKDGTNRIRRDFDDIS